MKLSATFTALIAIFCAPLIYAELDTAKIEQITGLKGTLNESEGVYKISVPRDDVKVRVDGKSVV